MQQKINYADIINLYFLILNKRRKYFDKKKVILILSNKIINYGFEIFNLRDLGMTFRNLRFRDFRFKLGIFIFGSGTKVTIFYFHFSPCDTLNRII